MTKIVEKEPSSWSQSPSSPKSASPTKLAPIKFLVETGESPSPSYRNYSPQPQRAAGFSRVVLLAVAHRTPFMIKDKPWARGECSTMGTVVRFLRFLSSTLLPIAD